MLPGDTSTVWSVRLRCRYRTNLLDSKSKVSKLTNCADAMDQLGLNSWDDSPRILDMFSRHLYCTKSIQISLTVYILWYSISSIHITFFCQIFSSVGIRKHAIPWHCSTQGFAAEKHGTVSTVSGVVWDLAGLHGRLNGLRFGPWPSILYGDLLAWRLRR